MNVVMIIFLLASILEEIAIITKASLMTSTDTELCGLDSEVIIDGNGETSSKIVSLNAVEPGGLCQIRVVGPSSHVINLQFIETSVEIHRALFNETKKHPPCIMSVFLPENSRKPFWQGDPCSGDSLPEADLLTPDFKIVWVSPKDASYAKERKIVLTAVGQGVVCKEPGQYTCMRVGWVPSYCISDYLLCDGYTNCPKSSSMSDEDEKLCHDRLLAQSTWEQLALEIFKKLRPPKDGSKNHQWLRDKFQQLSSTSSSSSSASIYPYIPSSSVAPKKSYGDWREWQDLKRITTAKPVMEKKATDSISSVLSKYGPWGYLMLGMLICGTVLMFCGLWECCFRKPKTTIEPAPATQPTTVLIINNHQDENANTPLPPNYDELDQPPSYTTLFPHMKQSRSSVRRSEDCGESSRSSSCVVEVHSDSNNINSSDALDNYRNSNSNCNVSESAVEN